MEADGANLNSACPGCVSQRLFLTPCFSRFSFSLRITPFLRRNPFKFLTGLELFMQMKYYAKNLLSRLRCQFFRLRELWLMWDAKNERAAEPSSARGQKTGRERIQWSREALHDESFNTKTFLQLDVWH